MSDLKSVIVYTDGGCDPNPGIGGYGVVLLHGDRRRELSGAFRLTTNNRMEIMAAIVGLEAIRMPCQVEVRSDSQYVVKAVEKRWLQLWEARSWTRKDGQPVPNRDLWKRLLELCRKHQVTVRWVPGHSGVAENERCDELAAEARLAPHLPDDSGYLDGAAQKARAEIATQAPLLPPLAAETRPTFPAAGIPVREEGQPCRKCGTPVVRRVPKRKKAQGKLYVYAYYLYCVGCRTLYLVASAKMSPSELAQRSHDAARARPVTPLAPRPGAPAATPSSNAPAVLVQRLYECTLAAHPDAALFNRLSRRLEAEPGASLVRRLEIPGHQIFEYRLDGKPVLLELHPERGIALQVRGKRNRDLLTRLAERLRG